MNPRAQPRSLRTLLGRAVRLRCPVCGQGPVFRGLLRMNTKCTHCGLRFEREPGYFLGSIYINYALTVLVATVAFLAALAIWGRTPLWLLLAVTAFCVLFPIAFFRHARCFWLCLDHFLNPVETAPQRPAHPAPDGPGTCL